MINRCVQCNEDLIPCKLGEYYLYYCVNPVCPAYGLLQIGTEGIDDDEETYPERN